MIERIRPVRVVASKDTDNEQILFQNKPLQAALNDNDCMEIKQDGYIMLDFGKEISGGIAINVRVTTRTPQCAKCRITFGESVMEAMSELGEKGACNNHSVRDTIVDIGYYGTFKFGTTGFRFVRIAPVDAVIRIRAIEAENNMADLEYRGSFKCNDELLNNIWQTGAYTVHLNANEYLWDGVKRDRLVWIGDMHPEVSTVSAVFGKVPCVMRSLDFIRNGTPSDEWMNEIITYSMWWIIIHYDFYMHWGDYAYLGEQKEYMKELLLKTLDWIDGGCCIRLEVSKMEGFVDWSSKDSESEVEGRLAITCMALRCGSEMMKALGEDAVAERCSIYADRLCADSITEKSNKRISALTVLSGRDKSLATEVLCGNSAEEMSCFMGYYVLKAKAMLGDYRDALDIIREYWGGMLKMGATTFWEDFDIEWLENSARVDELTPDGMRDIHGDFGKHCYKGFRHSLCHGWASGPTAFLMEQIGGIEILEAGCRSVRIVPRLAGLEWIEVEYPTPYGSIKISSNDNGTRVSAPAEITVICDGEVTTY